MSEYAKLCPEVKLGSQIQSLLCKITPVCSSPQKSYSVMYIGEPADIGSFLAALPIQNLSENCELFLMRSCLSFLEPQMLNIVQQQARILDTPSAPGFDYLTMEIANAAHSEFLVFVNKPLALTQISQTIVNMEKTSLNYVSIPQNNIIILKRQPLLQAGNLEKLLNQPLDNTKSPDSVKINQNPDTPVEFDNYSSHLSIFEKVFSEFNVKHALEFGPGKYSTKFLIDRCESVMSVEQDSLEWYNTLKSQHNSPNWNIIFHQNQNPRLIFNQLDSAGRKFDLVFSDGAYNTRCLVANLALERNVPIVLLHDSEKIWYYKWNLLNIPANYARFDFRHNKGVHKVTTVLVNEKVDLVDKWVIPEHDRILYIYSSPRQPVFQVSYSRLNELPIL